MRYRSLFLVVGILFAPICLPASLDPAALKVINDFAGPFCAIGPTSGSTIEGGLSLEAKAKFNGLLRKLSDAGLDANAKFGGTRWQGPLQKDLAGLLNDQLQCREHVFDKLLDTLQAEPAPRRTPSTAAKPSKPACGKHGTWSLSRQIVTSSESPAGAYADHWPVPQASCHPHCHPGEGDWYTHDFELSGPDKAANLELRNCHVSCSGAGGMFAEWSPSVDKQPTMIDPTKAEAHIMSRSLSCSLDIGCDKVRVTKTATESQYSHGTMTNHQTFSFDVMNDTDSALTLTTSKGSQEITSDQLKSWTGVPTWLAKQSQQVNGLMTTYTVSVSTAGCL